MGVARAMMLTTAVVALCAVAGATDASRPRFARSTPVVRRLRGGALWVKGPDDDRRLQIVHSLAKFCEEHELDEEAMRAVAAGEAKDHKGWDCGELCEYDSAEETATKATTVTDSGEVEKVEEDEEVEEVEDVKAAASDAAAAEEEPPPPPQMSQMLLKMGLPMVANQLLKRACASCGTRSARTARTAEAVLHLLRLGRNSHTRRPRNLG